jgi:hypothetical protein
MPPPLRKPCFPNENKRFLVGSNRFAERLLVCRIGDGEMRRDYCGGVTAGRLFGVDPIL